MLKLYRKSQEVQLNWIRNHFKLWIILNVIGTVAYIGYLEYRDHREKREFEKEFAQQNQ